eukprot:8388107-Pyramimonas_sp.AAC.1
MFHARTLVASPAYSGPAGGCTGGVAIIIPHGTTLLRAEDLVPGCAVAATIRRGDSTYRLVSVYLPPSRKAETIEAIRQAIE